MSWQGRLAYADALRMMEESRDALLADPLANGTLFLCHHPPVITLGRHASPDNLLVSAAEAKREGIEIQQIDRGGDVTYHGPGQLMVYPVVRIGVGVHAFLTTVAAALTRVVTDYGVANVSWRDDEPGLWLRDRKLAACGVHISRGVSIHGFALNVNTPPAAWNCIVPCGLGGPAPISMAEALPEGTSSPDVTEVSQHLEPVLRDALRSYGVST